MPIRWWDKRRLACLFSGFFFILIFPTYSLSQPLLPELDSPMKIGRMPAKYANKVRLRHLIIGESVVYTSAMTGLYFLWYKDHPSTSFHSFDDWPEWQQMDKAGHFITGYVLSEMSFKCYQWTEMDPRKALKIGCLQSLVFMTSLEVFDGFSQGWGFSWSDMGFNVLGVSAYYISNSNWSRFSVRPKFSFGRSEIAPYRPDLLGNNFTTSLLKDYNGQTYWLSLNLKRLIKPDDFNVHNFWDALCVSFGYGAHGMTGGRSNVSINEQGQAVPEFERFHQYYLSLDLDLSEFLLMKLRNRFLRKALNTINFIKIPFPGLEFSRGKVFINWTGYGI